MKVNVLMPYGRYKYTLFFMYYFLNQCIRVEIEANRMWFFEDFVGIGTFRLKYAITIIKN